MACGKERVKSEDYAQTQDCSVIIKARTYARTDRYKSLNHNEYSNDIVID